MSKILPYLWFDKNLKEIIAYYTAIFPDIKVKTTGTLSDTPSGEVETATVEILGQEFGMMTAGPLFKFNESVSFVINCDDQKEVDYYWNALTTNGGEESQCGWCKDKYGLSWQITPVALNDMMSSSNKEAIGRVVQAFMKMKKLDLKTLEEAFNG